MGVEQRRRIALHRAATATWGEEVADTLVELVAPSGDELATRSDVAGVRREVDGLRQEVDGVRRGLETLRQEVLGALESMEHRITSLETSMDHRITSSEHRLTATFERRIADAISMQTRTLVISQLGALVVIAGLAFGLR